MNLFICFTPLQILICEKIIQNYHNEEFEFAIMQNSTDKKIEHYIKNIKSKKTTVLYLKKNSRLASIKVLFKVKTVYRKKYYKNVFLVTPKDFITRMILNNIKYVNLFSFDDGAANVFKDSWVYIDENKNLSFLKQKIRAVLEYIFSTDPKKSEFYIKEIKEHFTIIRNLPNITKNIKFISLLDSENITLNKNLKTIKVFLGQPVYGADIKTNKEVIESIIKKYSINYYLPHPRDEYEISNAIYIKTNLISEDYFLQQIKNNQNIKYVLYGFFTTSFFTLVQIENTEINAIFLQDDTVFTHKKELYNLMKKLNINIEFMNKKDLLCA